MFAAAPGSCVEFERWISEGFLSAVLTVCNCVLYRWAQVFITFGGKIEGNMPIVNLGILNYGIGMDSDFCHIFWDISFLKILSVY